MGYINQIQGIFINFFNYCDFNPLIFIRLSRFKGFPGKGGGLPLGRTLFLGKIR